LGKAVPDVVGEPLLDGPPAEPLDDRPPRRVEDERG
jgi:hypothetical protein